MDSDDRFKHLASDPRFKTLRKKQQKIKIDDRFQSMFTDEKFTLKYSKDKRGRNQKKTSGDDLKRYYSLDEKDDNKKVEKTSEKIEEEEEEEEDSEKDIDSETVAAGEDLESDEESEAGEDEDEENEGEEESTETELSSSSDESESDPEDLGESDQDGGEIDVAKIKYNWQPLDHDAEKTEATTKRLAIQNLDWDHLDIRDIYTLINSIRPPLSVKLYISEFGKERLAKEELEGPQEIIEMPKDDEIEDEYNQLKDKMRRLKNQEIKTYRVNEYEDADEEMDPQNEEIRERVRRYQLNRMKYYYAVAEFDSAESAELVYKELDGMEYEGSSLELDLRFIPDDMEFDPADVKAECDKPPDLATYKAPQFINTALQQTTVKFTWDETDSKRQDKLRRAYTKEELEKDDLDAYLASETDSEEDLDEDCFGDTVSVVTANSEARARKYQMLLQSLDAEEAKKKKVDVDVEWGNYSEDEQNVGTAANDQSGSEDMAEAFDDQDSMDESDSEPESPKASAMKKRAKKSKKGKKNKRKKHDDETEEDKELDLLVMDVEPKGDNFKFNPEDDRFNAVYESGKYNIDPSHPNFKRTEAFDIMAEKKRQKRQRANQTQRNENRK